MISSSSLARTVDSLHVLIAQLTERVASLEARLAVLEGPEPSWDVVSEPPSGSVHSATVPLQPAAIAPGSSPAPRPVEAPASSVCASGSSGSAAPSVIHSLGH